MKSIRHWAIRMTRVAVVSIVLLGATACEDLDLLLDLFVPGDLSVDPDPAVQAAEASHQAINDIETGERSIGEVIDPDREPDELVDLAPVAKRDVKVAVYLAWLAVLDGNRDLALSAHESARDLWAVIESGPDSGRRWQQMTLDALNDVLVANGPSDDYDAAACHGDFSDPPACRRASMVNVYCSTLNSYRNNHGSTFEGQAYLQFANTSYC